jgi:4-amino-4-deoxy-L-arabinose transferase-like glycosyltransferase
MKALNISPKWLAAGEIGLLLAVAIIPRGLTLGGTFVVNDETLYWDWSNQFIQALLSGNWAETIVGKAYPAVTVMWVQVAGFGLRWLWAWLTASLDSQFFYQLGLDRPLDFSLLGQRRLPMALANAGLVVLVYFYVRALYGRGVAMVAALLIGLDPFYLSDARTMRGDSLMAGFMTLSALALLLACRRQSWRQLVFSGVMAGLALLTKMSALPIIIFGMITLAGYGLANLWRTGDKMDVPLRGFGQNSLKAVLLWLAAALLTCFALWPALWAAPDQIWQKMALFTAESADGRPTYFMGQHTETELLPLFYPVTFFFRATPLTLIGLGILFIAGPVFIQQRRQRSGFLTLTAAELGLLGLYCLLYTGLMTVGLLKRSWYLLPIFPVTMIMAAYGWVWLARQIRRYWTAAARPMLWRAILLAAVGGMLIVQVAQAISAQPYYYAYWNPLAAGRFAPNRLELLSWGLDASLAGQWLNAQPNSEQLKIATRPSLREVRPVINGILLPFNSEELWAQADYIVLRYKHLQLEEHEPYQLDYLQKLSPVYTMTLNGVIFGWIYPGPAAQVALNSELTGKATLLGYTLPAQPLQAGQPALLKVFWRNEGLAPDERIFVRLVDGDGFIWQEVNPLPLPGFEKAAVTPGAIVHSQADLSPLVGTPPAHYFLKIGIEQRQNRQLIGEFTLADDYDDLAVTQTVTAPVLPPLTYREAHPFGPDLLLLGYNLPARLPSVTEVVDLYWQAQRDIKDTDYVLALRLRDRAGAEGWYHLARPARGIYPTPGWVAGEIVRDPWSAPPINAVPPGRYTLELEVYDAIANHSMGKMTLGEFQIDAAS